MPRSRVQHQKSLLDDAFEQRYPNEEACRKAWFACRWPEGFKCPWCAATEYFLKVFLTFREAACPRYIEISRIFCAQL